MPRQFLAVLLPLSLLLTGCNQPDAVDLVETYASRTSNAIEIDYELELAPAANQYPLLTERRERIAEVAEVRQGLLELVELRHCGLVSLVAERNTSLGKLATPSQRLIYELKFIPELHRCVDSIRDNPELREMTERLEAVKQIKISAFAPQLFNSLYNSEEMEKQFSVGAEPFSPNPDLLDTGAVSAIAPFGLLADLVDSDQWQTPSFADQLETNYEQLYRSNFGAQWLASFALLTQTLDQTAQAIESRLDGRPICFMKKQNSQSKILWNVFNKFYVGQLQPYLALVERDARNWQQTNIEILESLKDSVPETSHFLLYFEEDGPVWEPYLKARNRHTNAWQTILDQCGLRPGNPNG